VVLVSTDAEAVAILAAINAVAAPQFYDADDVPATLPSEYGVISLSRMFGGVDRQDGYKGLELRRLQVDVASKTSVGGARTTYDAVRTALENVILTVGSQTIGPIRFESDVGIGPDSGYYFGRSFWTYGI
jgi:hypothetical protein